ncbi:Reprolysin family propeptide [Methanolobus tindarius DSM 2278]|uniref:Reprolysin family propeptide n=1 Tax=Methanolobus tindarius DSM 2278 TaxID=1090322 RepID=W9DX19_METTI|nr:M12 family metallo-peptidase [Methanolobus tindarius]ETA67966.1 Reprolysin family propeptide [Methanolobus tindarius DSM 2278]
MRNKQTIAICFVIAIICSMAASAEAVEASNDNLQASVESDTLNEHFEKISIDKSDRLNLRSFDSIKKYDFVTVDPIAFQKDANSGEITIEIAGEDFKLELEPAIYINEGDTLAIHNETGLYEIEMPEIYTYNGKVVGYPESKTRFTVSDTGLVGRVEIGDIKYIIERAGYIERDGKKTAVNVVYSNVDISPSGTLPSSDDLVYDSTETSDTFTSGELSTQAIASSMISTQSTKSATTVDLLAIYDGEFRDIFGNYDDCCNEIYDMMETVNEVYSSSDIGVNLDITHVVRDTGLDETNGTALLNEFRDRDDFVKEYYNCDIAFLYTGKEIDDNVIGKAYKYDTTPNKAYALAQMTPGNSTYTADLDDRSMVVAHEIGHVFNAHHEDYNETPIYAKATQWTYLQVWDRYSIMYSQFQGIGYLGGMQFEFSTNTSTGNGDADHDNARSIREVKNIVAAFE